MDEPNEASYADTAELRESSDEQDPSYPDLGAEEVGDIGSEIAIEEPNAPIIPDSFDGPDEHSLQSEDKMEENMPVVALMKTFSAPSADRLDSMLAIVQKEARPVLPASNAFLKYPRPFGCLKAMGEDGFDPQSGVLCLQEYWNRVDTYTAVGWFGKPVPLSPIQCARFGWKLHSTDTLSCVHCKKQLIYQDSDPSQLVSHTEKFVSLLKSTHQEECPFRRDSISTAAFTLPSHPASAVSYAFYERLEYLKNYASSVSIQEDYRPQIDMQPINSIALSNDIDFDVLCEYILAHQNSSSRLGTSLVALAIAGWVPQALSGAAPSSSSVAQKGKIVPKDALMRVKCLYCRRKVSLGFSSPAAISPSNEPSELPPPKRTKFTEPQAMDPVGDHRPYCPWINRIEKDNQLVGWQHCLRNIVISTEKSVERSSSYVETSEIGELPVTAEQGYANTDSNSSLLSRLSRTLERVQALSRQ
jgi:hypothetical protein